MDKSIQLARNIRKNYTSSAHDTVISSATHAFYLNHWFIDNETQQIRDLSLKEINNFTEPKSVIERLFATLRLICEVETGYYQILSVPTDWEYEKKADLPHIYVSSEKHYPEKFENYGWNRESKKIEKQELDLFKKTYDRLEKNQFTLAVKRLNSAITRKNEEDSILDITIVLESLLANDSNSEITYRLATRAAHICQIEPFNNYSSKHVFELCKKIYNYRSAIVHGNFKKIERSRKIKMSDSEEIEIIDISLQFLKHVTRVLINHNIKGPKEIDELMF